MERRAARRSSVGAVITTFLSLLVVAAAVAVVAYFVLRSPSSAVDSAERLEPVGTALPAPTEPPTLPTPIPTAPPEPTALGFTGEQPANTALPTVVAPIEAPAEAPAEQTGPTPTPRVLALPTEAPPTVAPPPPTLPPSAPPTNVPVVALAPVEAAPPPTAAPQEVTLQPAPTPLPVNTDPLNVFGENDPPRIVPSGNDARDRVRAIQDDINGDINQRRGRNTAEDDPEAGVPAAIAVAPTIVAGNGGAVEILVPDVDAMIEEITARTTDPNRNPNVGSAGRAITEREPNSSRDDNTSGHNDNGKKKKNTSRGNRRPTTVVVPGAPSIQPGNTGNQGNQGNQGDCPFSNLPEDQRPKDWPFGDC